VDADGDEDFDSERFFAYDGNQIVLAFDGDSDTDLTNRYLWGPVVDQILADEQVTSLGSAGDVIWPLTDHLGTARDLAEYTDGPDTTAITNHRIYDSFGNLVSETNSAVDHLFGFTARPWDEETDLQYNLNRWYDPVIGQWMSEDPIGFAAGDANVRRYVGNESVNAADPSGLVPWRPGLLPGPSQPLSLWMTNPGSPAPWHTQPVVRPVVIVSGFGAYGEYRTDNANPASPMSRDFRNALESRDIRCEAISGLPVRWGAFEKRLAYELKRHAGVPIIWIAFGGGAPEFRLETWADNLRAESLDAVGQRPGNQVPLLNDSSYGQEHFEISRLTEEAIAEIAAFMQAKGQDLKVSDDADRYICDSAAFHLYQAEREGRISVGIFLHLPEAMTAQERRAFAEALADALFDDSGMFTPSSEPWRPPYR
jgi:RHS repeat-associated protein